MESKPPPQVLSVADVAAVEDIVQRVETIVIYFAASNPLDEADQIEMQLTELHDRFIALNATQAARLIDTTRVKIRSLFSETNELAVEQTLAGLDRLFTAIGEYAEQLRHGNDSALACLQNAHDVLESIGPGDVETIDRPSLRREEQNGHSDADDAIRPVAPGKNEQTEQGVDSQGRTLGLQGQRPGYKAIVSVLDSINNAKNKWWKAPEDNQNLFDLLHLFRQMKVYGVRAEQDRLVELVGLGQELIERLIEDRIVLSAAVRTFVDSLLEAIQAGVEDRVEPEIAISEWSAMLDALLTQQTAVREAAPDPDQGEHSVLSHDEFGTCHAETTDSGGQSSFSTLSRQCLAQLQNSLSVWRSSGLNDELLAAIRIGFDTLHEQTEVSGFGDIKGLIRRVVMLLDQIDGTNTENDWSILNLFEEALDMLSVARDCDPEVAKSQLDSFNKMLELLDQEEQETAVGYPNVADQSMSETSSKAQDMAFEGGRPVEGWSEPESFLATDPLFDDIPAFLRGIFDSSPQDAEDAALDSAGLTDSIEQISLDQSAVELASNRPHHDDELKSHDTRDVIEREEDDPFRFAASVTSASEQPADEHDPFPWATSLDLVHGLQDIEEEKLFGLIDHRSASGLHGMELETVLDRTKKALLGVRGDMENIRDELTEHERQMGLQIHSLLDLPAPSAEMERSGPALDQYAWLQDKTRRIKGQLVRLTHIERAFDDKVSILDKRLSQRRSQERQVSRIGFAPVRIPLIEDKTFNGSGMGLVEGETQSDTVMLRRDDAKVTEPPPDWVADGASDNNTQTGLVLRVPVMQVMLVKLGVYRCAILSGMIERVDESAVSRLVEIDGQRHIQLEGKPVPLVDLCERMGIQSLRSKHNSVSSLLIRRKEQLMAFSVDAFLETASIVCKTPGTQLRSIGGVVGVTLLSDTSLALVLDPLQLIDRQVSPADTLELKQVTQPVSQTMPTKANEAIRRILVVDDSVVARRDMRRMIEIMGLEAVMAKSATDALAVLEREQVDMLLVDVEMPHMNGYELLVKLREDIRFQNLLVIMILVERDTPYRVMALDLGADNCIIRPFSSSELEQVIDDITYNEAR